MDRDSVTICVFGEVLFDCLPDGKQVLGGAPFNVAWHLQALGQSTRFISRVGADPRGDDIRAAMLQWGMDTSELQTDPELPTGRVEVSIHDGEPAYDIVAACAYDAIAMPQCDRCDWLYHGSLATRDPKSAATLRAIRSRAPGTVFMDVNLRPPWWSKSQVGELLAGADWVKLNADELTWLTGELQASKTAARELLQRCDLQGVLLTHGARGAELLLANGEKCDVAPSTDVKVVDTIGAGDAFTAVTILGLVNRWPPAIILERAQQFASCIVGQSGAVMTDPAQYRDLCLRWNLDA